MPAVYYFLIDVSSTAVQTGAVAAACSAIHRALADLPVSVLYTSRTLFWCSCVETSSSGYAHFLPWDFKIGVLSHIKRVDAVITHAARHLGKPYFSANATQTSNSSQFSMTEARIRCFLGSLPSPPTRAFPSFGYFSQVWWLFLHRKVLGPWLGLQLLTLRSITTASIKISSRLTSCALFNSITHFQFTFPGS